MKYADRKCSMWFAVALTPFLNRYKKLALKLHPDRNKGEQAKVSATEKFALVNRAFSVLSDENKRYVYDKYGADGVAAMERTESEQAQEYQDDLHYQKEKPVEEVAKQVQLETRGRRRGRRRQPRGDGRRRAGVRVGGGTGSRACRGCFPS